MDRGEQIHRAYLVDHVNPYNPIYAEYSRIAGNIFTNTGLNPHARQQATYALINKIVNRQASMLAYNDVSWICGILFLCTVSDDKAEIVGNFLKIFIIKKMGHDVYGASG